MPNELSTALELEYFQNYFSDALNTLLRALHCEDWKSDDTDILRELAEDIYDIASDFEHKAARFVRNVKREQRRDERILEDEHPGRIAAARTMLENGLPEKAIAEYCGLALEEVHYLAAGVKFQQALLEKQQPSAA